MTSHIASPKKGKEMPKLKLVQKGKLVKELNISVPTIRYYTDIGLFKISKTTPAGYFLYDLEQTRKVYNSILKFKENRLTITEIKEKIEIEGLLNKLEK